MERLRIELSVDAEREIKDALAWWRSNRSAAPDALRKEIRRALEVLRTQPQAGMRASNVRLSGVRRLNLHRRVRYQIYYRLSEDGSTVVVLRLWHMSRGTSPGI